MIVFSSKFIERLLQERPWKALPPQRHSGNLKIGPKFQIEVYQELCEGLGRPPTSDEFWDKYYQLNHTDIENLSLEEKGGLQKRVHDKAWAAFICEDHFLGLLLESGEFDSVERSIKLDTSKGIDFRIARNYAVYGVKTHFSGTKSIDDSWMARKKWRKTTLQLNNIKIIDMPLTKPEAKLIGNVYLYTLQHISELLRKVEIEEAQEINAEGKGKPAAPPETIATTAPPESGDEIERLRLNWRQFIRDAPPSMSQTPAAALLRSAKPKTFEKNTVVLSFRYPLHKENMEKPDNRQIAEKIISNFLGRPCRIRSVYEPEDYHLIEAALKIGAQIIDAE